MWGGRARSTGKSDERRGDGEDGDGDHTRRAIRRRWEEIRRLCLRFWGGSTKIQSGLRVGMKWGKREGERGRNGGGGGVVDKKGGNATSSTCASARASEPTTYDGRGARGRRLDDGGSSLAVRLCYADGAIILRGIAVV